MNDRSLATLETAKQLSAEMEPESQRPEGVSVTINFGCRPWNPDMDHPQRATSRYGARSSPEIR